MTDRKKFVAAISLLATTLNRELDDAAMEGYWLALRELPEEELRTATARALQSCRFMPTPAELLELCGRGGAKALAAAQADAWGVVMDAVRRHDYTHSVDFGPLVNSIVHNMGGWIWLCDRSTRDLTFDRKKFEELYAAFAPRAPGDLQRTEPCRGAFGGTPIRIAIGGTAPPARQIESAQRNGVNDVVRKLADAKDATAEPKPPTERIAP